MSNGKDDHARRPGLPGQIAKLKREHDVRLSLLEDDVSTLRQALNLLRLEAIGRFDKLERAVELARDYMGRVRKRLARMPDPDKDM